MEIYHQKTRRTLKSWTAPSGWGFVSGIKLWVDVAPIIENDTLKIENVGWIPRKDKWRLTSVTAHNDFVSKRNVGEQTRVRPRPFQPVWFG